MFCLELIRILKPISIIIYIRLILLFSFRFQFVRGKPASTVYAASGRMRHSLQWTCFARVTTENLWTRVSVTPVVRSCATYITRWSGGDGIQRMQKRWVQVGIVSAGKGCAVEGQFAFYTHVPRLINWVYSVLRGNHSRTWTGDHSSIKGSP